MNRPLRLKTALRSALLAALIVLVLAASALAAPFSFVALGDSRGNRPHEPVNLKVLSTLVGKILTLEPRPAFVLFSGDMVLGDRDHRSPPLAEQLKLWQQAMSSLVGAGIKLYIVPGNHEIGGLAAPECERTCQSYLGELQYGFEHEGSRFLALNTDRAGHPGEADLAWLEAELIKARQAGAAHVFVLGHEPAYPSLGEGRGLKNGRQLWDLLARYGADAYLCGHEHLYARRSEQGVLQVTTGGAGGPLYPFGGAPGFEVVQSRHHLTVWRIDGPRVEVQAQAPRTNPGGWDKIDSFFYLKTPPRSEVAPAAVESRPGL